MKRFIYVSCLIGLSSGVVSKVFADSTTMTIPTAGLPILEFGPLLTFIVRMVFVITGIAALLYGLMGGLDWINSGGDKEDIQEARDKITAAIIGLFVLIMVLTILWTVETVVFRRAICFGISCDIRVPSLVDGGSSLAGSGSSSGGSAPGGGSSSGGGAPGGGAPGNGGVVVRGGRTIPDTTGLIDTCTNFCQSLDKNYDDGYCMISDPIQQCPADFYYEDPPPGNGPGQDKSVCYDINRIKGSKDEEGPCCCFQYVTGR